MRNWRLYILMGGLCASSGFPDPVALDPAVVTCPTSLREVVAAKVRATAPPFEWGTVTRLEKNRDGSYQVFETEDGGATYTVIGQVIPVRDPQNPTHKFRVIYGKPGEPGYRESISEEPLASVAAIKAENRIATARSRQLRDEKNAALKRETATRRLLDTNIAFYGAKAAMPESLKMVAQRNPALTPLELETVALAHAIATSERAYERVFKGIRVRSHDRATYEKLLRGEAFPDETISSDTHQIYTETVLSLQSMRKHGFQKEADQIANDILERLSHDRAIQDSVLKGSLPPSGGK